MKKYFRGLLLAAMLVLALSVTALAADTTVTVEATDEKATATIDASNEKVTLTYADETLEDGEQYVVLMVTEDANNTYTEDTILYIDQQGAKDGKVSFDVYPSEMKNGTIVISGGSLTGPLTVATVTVQESQVGDDLLGDVNGDNYVNMKDFTLVMRSFLGKTELTDAQLAKADINGDTYINGKDVVKIGRIYLGKE